MKRELAAQNQNGFRFSANSGTFECGYEGITEFECTLLGCTLHSDFSCRDTTENNPRGYFSCSSDLSERSDCGYPNISEDACSELSCCFRDSACFFPKAGEGVEIVPSIFREAKGPLFSIVLTCYGNDANFISNALRSITSQSYTVWEAVVVDDGSPNRDCVKASQEIISHLSKSEKRKFSVVFKENGFIADARNYGIARSRGKYILPVDADDYLSPNFLAEAARALRNDTGIELLYADQFFFGIPSTAPHWYLWKNMRLQSALKRGPLPVTTIYTKDLWTRVGGYKMDMIFGNEDYNYWLDILSTFPKSKRIPGISSWYRLKAVSMSKEADYKVLALPMLRTHQATFFSHDQIVADLAKIFCYLHNSRHFYRLKYAIERQPESCPGWLWYALNELSIGNVKVAQEIISTGLSQCESTRKSYVIRQFMEKLVYRISMRTRWCRYVAVKCNEFDSVCSSCEKAFKTCLQ